MYDSLQISTGYRFFSMKQLHTATDSTLLILKELYRLTLHTICVVSANSASQNTMQLRTVSSTPSKLVYRSLLDQNKTQMYFYTDYRLLFCEYQHSANCSLSLYEYGHTSNCSLSLYEYQHSANCSLSFYECGHNSNCILSLYEYQHTSNCNLNLYEYQHIANCSLSL